MRRLTIIIAFSTLAILLGVYQLSRQQGPDRRYHLSEASLAQSSLGKANVGKVRLGNESAASARKIFPFSVVPGGVYGASEVVARVQRDSVVAAHYAPIRLGQLHRVVLQQPKLAFVSYRKKGTIYWTARPVALPKGEVVLSDGDKQIRARCGNRISDVAQGPVEAPADAPEASVLDTPLGVPDGIGNTADVQLSIPMAGYRLPLALLVADSGPPPPIAGAVNNPGLWVPPYSNVPIGGLVAQLTSAAPTPASIAPTPDAILTGASLSPTPTGPVPIYTSPVPTPTFIEQPPGVTHPGTPGGPKPPETYPPSSPPPVPPNAAPPPPGLDTPSIPATPEDTPTPDMPHHIDTPGCQYDCQPVETPPTATPEPGTWVMMAVGMAALAAGRKLRPTG